MGGQQISTGKLIVILLAAILLTLLIVHTDRDKPYVPGTSLIPPIPDKSGNWYFDFNEEIWKQIETENPRANAPHSSDGPSGLSEDELREHLEKNVDGYLEDTYWGEEFDIDND